MKFRRTNPRKISHRTYLSSTNFETPYGLVQPQSKNPKKTTIKSSTPHHLKSYNNRNSQSEPYFQGWKQSLIFQRFFLSHTFFWAFFLFFFFLILFSVFFLTNPLCRRDPIIEKRAHSLKRFPHFGALPTNNQSADFISITSYFLVRCWRFGLLTC